MANKRRGQLTVTGEWARHLRPLLRRVFWKRERQAGRDYARKEREALTATRPGPLPAPAEIEAPARDGSSD